MDRDGYPDDADLEFIDNYSLLDQGTLPLINHILKIWHWPEYATFDADGVLTLVTGGWSGNESIVSALEPTEFWLFYWQSSERGGRFVFKIPVRKEAK